MRITFLGTSAGVPTRSRNVSCVALRLPERGEVWLFDCGEGTQHQILESDVKISQITRIFITHMHGDHIFGLPGLLATCGMAGGACNVEVFGPPGIEEFVRETARRSDTRFSNPVETYTIADGDVVDDDDDFVVTCAPLAHRIPAFGFRVTERDKQGQFNLEKATEMGIPSGPLYGKLKRGESITLADGRIVDGRDFSGTPLRGRTVVYCTDTTFCRNSVELARDADLLIHEATFARRDEALARQSMHSSAEMAAEVARAAKVQRLLITHFSPRYAHGQPVTPDDLLAEARAIFPRTEMARDFLTVEVARRQHVATVNSNSV